MITATGLRPGGSPLPLHRNGSPLPLHRSRSPLPLRHNNIKHNNNNNILNNKNNGVSRVPLLGNFKMPRPHTKLAMTTTTDFPLN